MEYVKRHQYDSPRAEVLRRSNVRGISARRAALLRDPRLGALVYGQEHPQIAIRRRQMEENKKKNSQSRLAPLPNPLRGYMHWARKRGKPQNSGISRRHGSRFESGGRVSAMSPGVDRRPGARGGGT
jgi:hypothetical protein